MKKFWIINLSIATVGCIAFFLIVVFILTDANGIRVDIRYFKSLFYILCLTALQFTVGLIYYLIKLKQHSHWIILALVYLLALCFLEMTFSFGLLGGLLGDG